MALELKKIRTVQLRSLGLDERWLQDRIAEDPSLLGLGELDVIRKEKRQAPGGRIDFVMENTDDDIRYMVEVMLGPLDASHHPYHRILGHRAPALPFTRSPRRHRR